MKHMHVYACIGCILFDPEWACLETDIMPYETQCKDDSFSKIQSLFVSLHEQHIYTLPLPLLPLNKISSRNLNSLYNTYNFFTQTTPDSSILSKPPIPEEVAVTGHTLSTQQPPLIFLSLFCDFRQW